jgi:hypothetical protein
MAVYVDDGAVAYGQMLMCHMIADTREELDAMADAVGVKRKWIQYPGTYREHYDICKSKRNLAIENGAVSVTFREFGQLLKARRLKA